MEKSYYVVSTIAKEEGVWDSLQNKKVYLRDEEWRCYSWTKDFERAVKFGSIAEAKKRLFSDKTVIKMTDGHIYRPTSLHIAFGISPEKNTIFFEKVTVSTEVQEFMNDADIFDFDKLNFKGLNND